MDLGVGRRLSYLAARRLLVLTGLVVLGATAAVLYVRSVEDTEVIAVLLFAPIYLAVVLGKVRGGLLAGAVAAVVYGILRLGGVDAFDTGQQVQLIASRAIGYLVFGLAGGLAVRQLEAALQKLDRYDLVDADTGLFNARFAAQELELEMARSTRYGSGFTVVTIDGPIAPILAVRRSRRAALLRSLGLAVSDAVRLVDRAAIGQEGETFHAMVVMPETGPEGAAIVANRLATDVQHAFTAAGSGPVEGLRTTVLAFPTDTDAMAALRDLFVRLDAAEHPGQPAPTSA